MTVALALTGACGRINFDVAADPDGGTDDDAAVPTVNRAFVTSTTHAAGALGGVAGADAICSARAAEAGLDGTFIAYVSSTSANAPARLAGARGWMRVDRRPVADTAADVANGLLLHPLRVDEQGRDVGEVMRFVATGTFAGSLASNCADFMSSTGNVTVGLTTFSGGSWSANTFATCTDPTRLYCFQIDLDVPLVVERSTGRRAFVSTGAFTPSSGVAAADTLCASEANAANLTGTFRALLTTTAPAASRFDTTGAPWVRLDGIALGDSAVAILSSDMRAPLAVTTSGGMPDTYVLTGFAGISFPTAFDAADLLRNCNSWSDAAGGSQLGWPLATGSSSFNQTTADCVQPYPVYCFEN